MEVFLTEQFERAYQEISDAERRSVRKALILLGENLRHPSLRVKKMEGKRDIWEARPSKRLRMTFELVKGTVILRNLGEHDRVLKRP
jgi:mRNA-degrading endonuclease RelE of RelBE toxin-antitoxin system